MIFRLTNTANAKLAANPQIAQSVLSRREYFAGQNYPSVARLEYGNAVERMVASSIEKSPLKFLFQSIGGPGSPDFIGKAAFKGLQFDITTNNPHSILAHIKRPYGNKVILILYTRESQFRVFP